MEKIKFYLNNVEIGETILPPFTSDESRDLLAIKCNIKDYDNFYIISKNGDIRLDADKLFYEGIPYGKFSGDRFKERLKNNYYEER